VFDHERDARFPLGQAHAKVACAGCHEVERVGERELVRYRPLDTACAACHGTQADPLRRRR
jgi:cytochrome c553